MKLIETSGDHTMDATYPGHTKSYIWAIELSRDIYTYIAIATTRPKPGPGRVINDASVCQRVCVCFSG